MTSNVERPEAAPCRAPETEERGAPSCYRVSVLSGSLEVSARLRNADDLELLMKVLEANKGLFPTAGAISERDRRKGNQNISESERIRDRRICEGGPRDREFGESGSNSERNFDALEKWRSWTGV